MYKYDFGGKVVPLREVGDKFIIPEGTLIPEWTGVTNGESNEPRKLKKYREQYVAKDGKLISDVEFNSATSCASFLLGKPAPKSAIVHADGKPLETKKRGRYATRASRKKVDKSKVASKIPTLTEDVKSVVNESASDSSSKLSKKRVVATPTNLNEFVTELLPLLEKYKATITIKINFDSNEVNTEINLSK